MVANDARFMAIFRQTNSKYYPPIRLPTLLCIPFILSPFVLWLHFSLSVLQFHNFILSEISSGVNEIMSIVFDAKRTSALRI